MTGGAYDEIKIFDDYASFESAIVNEKTGRVNLELSFAKFGSSGQKVILKDNIFLWRKKEINETKIKSPQIDLSWWNEDGLYYKDKNIFPDARVSVFVKYDPVK